MMHSIRHVACLLFCCCSAILFAGIASAGPETILRDYVPDGRITRFEEPVRYWIGGQDRLEGQYYVETVVNEPHRIIPALPISQVTSQSQANLRIYLTDSGEEWKETITKSAEGVANWQENGPHIRGFSRIQARADGRILRADIVLHLDFQTSGGQKLWVVRHEFMHALGIMAHPKNAPNSVLNSNQAQSNKNGLFSDEDILVLRALYP